MSSRLEASRYTRISNLEFCATVEALSGAAELAIKEQGPTFILGLWQSLAQYKCNQIAPS